MLEAIAPAIPGITFRDFIEGARRGPPEDVGGPWGYNEFLEAIADPEHERHQELRDGAAKTSIRISSMSPKSIASLRRSHRARLLAEKPPNVHPGSECRGLRSSPDGYIVVLSPGRAGGFRK